MTKDVVMCCECESFFVNPEGITMCKNSSGLPFPSTADYCSYGKSTGESREVNNSELLKLVYQQRYG